MKLFLMAEGVTIFGFADDLAVAIIVKYLEEPVAYAAKRKTAKLERAS